METEDKNKRLEKNISKTDRLKQCLEMYYDINDNRV